MAAASDVDFLHAHTGYFPTAKQRSAGLGLRAQHRHRHLIPRDRALTRLRFQKLHARIERHAAHGAWLAARSFDQRFVGTRQSKVYERFAQPGQAELLDQALRAAPTRPFRMRPVTKSAAASISGGERRNIADPTSCAMPMQAQAR